MSDDRSAIWTAPVPSVADGATAGPERPILVDFLAWERATLVNICAGLSADQLALRSIPSSNLSLLGLVRHMAKVERTWFRIRLAGEPIPPLYDLALGKDYDFDHLDPAQAPEAFAQLDEEIRRADAAVRDLPLEHTCDAKGETYSMRMVYVHMIAEYSRHNGHADLLRESIDGVTGR